MIKYLHASKKLDEKIEGEFQTIKFHIKDIYDLEIRNILVDFCEDYDDPEEASSLGIYFSWEDVYSVDVDIFLEHLEEQVEKDLEEDFSEEDARIVDLRRMIKFLGNWNGYYIFFKEKDGEPSSLTGEKNGKRN